MERRGRLEGKGRKVAIVVSRFNDEVAAGLLRGALTALEQFGVSGVEVFWVPGALELPIVLKRLARKGTYDGLVALGAVVRGDTPHFDFVASNTTRGVQRVSLEESTPIALGVITADTQEQALARAGGKAGNRGRDAVINLLETVSLLEDIG